MGEKNVLVTGGGSGIGLAVCRKMAAEGHRIFAGYRNRPVPLETLTEEERSRIIPIELDVCDPSMVRNTVKEIEHEYGFIHNLVNCAGITDDRLLFMMPESSWDSVLDTNLRSLHQITTAVLPGMMAAGGGAIVFVSSIAGMKGVSGQTNYCASKAGMIGFARALAMETAKMGVRVNAVAPGYIDTSMIQGVQKKKPHLVRDIPMRRLGTPDEVARAVRFLLGDDASYITGTVLRVDGGVLA